MSVPAPPYLVVRRRAAFWVEVRPVSECSARLQALREGCFDDAFCSASSGDLWPVLGARLQQRPSWLDRLLPSRWVRVVLDLDDPRPASPPAIVAELATVLRESPDFADHLLEPTAQVLQRFEEARSGEEIIRIAAAQLALVASGEGQQ